MTPAGRFLLALCTGSAAALGLAFALPAERVSDSAGAAAARPPERIVYPADRRPSLPLPGGGARAVRSVLNVARPMRYGDYVWNDRGVPPGPVWVRVDLSAQLISVFRGGHEIGSALILYGADDKPTPPGVYPVLERARTHRSTLYDAEMPFMLRLTGDGVAIHASDVRASAATHGCVGVPLPFARRLFDQVRRGDPVAIVAEPRASIST